MPRRSELCFHSLSDLYFLKAMARLPMFFTCANDYADLLGEVSLIGSGSYILTRLRRDNEEVKIERRERERFLND
jgi:hypothetical protein